MKGYKKGTLLEEYFLNPHFKPTPKEEKELDDFFKLIKKKTWQKMFKGVS